MKNNKSIIIGMIAGGLFLAAMLTVIFTGTWTGDMRIEAIDPIPTTTDIIETTPPPIREVVDLDLPDMLEQIHPARFDTVGELIYAPSDDIMFIHVREDGYQWFIDELGDIVGMIFSGEGWLWIEDSVITHRNDRSGHHDDSISIFCIETLHYTTLYDISELGSFNDGLTTAAYRRTNEWGVIDTRGNWVILPQYFSAHGFFNGHAAVLTEHGWGVIRQDGSYVVNPIWNDIQHFGDMFMVQDNNRWGAVNSSGNLIILNQYEDIYYMPRWWSINDGFLRAVNGGLITVYDRHGNIIIPPRYSYIGAFHDGRAFYAADQSGPFGLIDDSGQVILPPQFQHYHNFSEGLAAVQNEHGYWGYINRNGDFVILLFCYDSEICSAIDLPVISIMDWLLCIIIYKMSGVLLAHWPG